MKYIVEIVAFDGENVESRLEYSSMHVAEKADSGVNRNLNHETHYTRIVTED